MHPQLWSFSWKVKAFGVSEQQHTPCFACPKLAFPSAQSSPCLPLYWHLDSEETQIDKDPKNLTLDITNLRAPRTQTSKWSTLVSKAVASPWSFAQPSINSSTVTCRRSPESDFNICTSLVWPIWLILVASIDSACLSTLVLVQEVKEKLRISIVQLNGPEECLSAASSLKIVSQRSQSWVKWWIAKRYEIWKQCR